MPCTGAQRSRRCHGSDLQVQDLDASGMTVAALGPEEWIPQSNSTRSLPRSNQPLPMAMLIGAPLPVLMSTTQLLKVVDR